VALTTRGVAHVWGLVAAEITERGGILRIGDGQQTADTPITAAEVVDGPMLEVRGTFDEGSANFEWKHQEVVLPTGTTLDVADEDLGRKTSASTGELIVRLKLVGS
jgi:hypothetical protein